jgi:hypothetical protein
MKVSDLIDRFNDGEWYKISKLFNSDLSTFINFFDKKGLLDKIDLESINRNDEDGTINQVCLMYLDKYGPDYFLKYLGDVQKNEDGYFLKLDDLSELSKLFDSGDSRGMTDEEIVSEVLSPDWFEMYSFSSRDIDWYSDIVDDLNEDNLKTLKSVVLDKLSGVEFDSEDFNDEWFYDQSDDNGMFTINETNIDQVFSDKSVFNELIWLDNLNETRSDLFSLYSTSYNEAWNDEVYEQIKTKISDYFDGDHIWEDEDVYFKIKNFEGDLRNFMTCMEGYSDSIIDRYDYLDMVKMYMTTCGNELRMYNPEYADSNLIRKNLNEYFYNYIY